MGVSLDASDRRGKNGQSLWALVLVAWDVAVSKERYRSFSSRQPLPEHRLEGCSSKERKANPRTSFSLCILLLSVGTLL